MEKDFFDEIQPSLLDRLGRVYSSDSGYLESVSMETEAFRHLEESFTESQLEMIKGYRDAIYRTGGVCELLAYRQGMRDLAAILGIGDKVQDKQEEMAVCGET